MTTEKPVLPVYAEHPDSVARIRSAKTAIEGILPLELYPAHKRELLGVCIWKVTEANGKKKLRYWSAGAIASGKDEAQHEHVHERRELIQRLLKGEQVDTVLIDAVACLVTKEEHRELTRSRASGWQRYVAANVRVYDAQEERWLNIPAR